MSQEVGALRQNENFCNALYNLCKEHHCCVHFQRALLHYFLGILFVFAFPCLLRHACTLLPNYWLFSLFRDICVFFDLFIWYNGYYVIWFGFMIALMTIMMMMTTMMRMMRMMMMMMDEQYDPPGPIKAIVRLSLRTASHLLSQPPPGWWWWW